MHYDSFDCFLFKVCSAYCFCSLIVSDDIFAYSVWKTFEEWDRGGFIKKERERELQTDKCIARWNSYTSDHLSICLLLMAVSVLLICGRESKPTLVSVQLQFHPIECKLSGADRCHSVIVSVLLACKDSPNCSTSSDRIFMRVFSAEPQDGEGGELSRE